MVTTVTDNRQTFFNDFVLARIMINEMQYVEMEGLVESKAWVLMPDHLHWLIGLTEESSLSRVMNFVKGRSSRLINKHLGRKGTVWQNAFYDHALRKDEDIKDAARYLVSNPLRAGLVDCLTDYPHWDAIWL